MVKVRRIDVTERLSDTVLLTRFTRNIYCIHSKQINNIFNLFELHVQLHIEWLCIVDIVDRIVFLRCAR